MTRLYGFRGKTGRYTRVTTRDTIRDRICNFSEVFFEHVRRASRDLLRVSQPYPLTEESINNAFVLENRDRKSVV